MITLRNLEKSYSHGVSKTFVLRQIDLKVNEGEFLSIMGPSGAGKSTLLHILGMHDQEGTTIIQVTHSEANAAYGCRVIQLRDGWVVKE
mgnify:CR=1 FL=1